MKNRITAISYQLSAISFFTLFIFLFTQKINAQTTKDFTMRTVKCGMQMPWEITYGPDNFIWTTEARGYKVSRVNPVDGSTSVLLDLTNNKNFPNYPTVSPQGGLTGLALHPQLLSGKPYVYLSYVYQYINTLPNTGGDFFKTKVVRYTYNAAAQTLTNEEVLCDTIPGSSDHNGGRMTIAPVNGQNFLFYSVGDMGAGQFGNANRQNHAQQTNVYEGKILRFNLEPDGDAGAFDKWNPNDNPFSSAVWSYGHRNPQGLVNVNGKLFEAEHGPYSDDEINIIERASNYGHPLVVGMADGNYNGAAVGFGTGVPIIVDEVANAASLGAAYRNPIKSLFPETNVNVRAIYQNYVNNTIPANNYFLSWNSIAPSGIDYYNSSAIPNWKNSLLVTSLKRRRIYRFQLDPTSSTIISDTLPLFEDQGRYRDIAISPDGTKIYVSCDSEGQTSGPTLGTTIDPPNKGCILEFTYVPPVVDVCANDVIPPVFQNCPQDFTVNIPTPCPIGSGAPCALPVAWTPPTATDNCTTNPTISSNLHPNAEAFALGTGQVIYTAIDAKNNKATCSFNVTVTNKFTAVGGCDAVTATSSNNTILLSGITNTTTVQVFNNAYSSNVFTQTVSTTNLNIPNLVSGQTYHVKIQQYDTSNGPWKFICERTIDVTVNGTTNTNTCRQQDSLSLVSIYNSTNGASWVFHKWDLTKPISTWYGVTLNATGCVTKISIDANGLSGTLPANISFDNLETFEIYQNNQLGGTIPNFNTPKLTTLSLTYDKLTGSIPSFTNLQNLKALGLDGNQLTGAVPNFNLPNLGALSLSANNLTGTIPNFVLPNLNQFNLSNNQLTGTIPNFINCPNLTTIVLNANQLTGTIPNFNFSQLQFLKLGDNKLTGTIPIFNLPSLSYLELYKNQLTGSIPNFILPSLIYLRIFNNQLTGSIPNLNLLNLQEFIVNNNNLSGCIPAGLKYLCGKTVDISGNTNLATQSFPEFCNNNAGACTTTTTSGCDAVTATTTNNAINLSGLSNTTTIQVFNNAYSANVFTQTVNTSTANIPNLTLGQNYHIKIQQYNTANGPWVFICERTIDAVVGSGGTQLPDLSLGNLILPASGMVGSIVNFTFDVINLSAVTANGNYTIGEYLSKDNVLSADDVLAGIVPTGFTPPGTIKNVPASITVPANLTPGAYYLICKTNIYNTINESIYADNIVSGTINIVAASGGGGNDLAVSLTANKTALQKFTTTNFIVTVKNNSGAAFTNISLKIPFPVGTSSGGTATSSIGNWNEWCAGGVHCFTWSIPTLAANSTATLNLPLFMLDVPSITTTASLIASTPVDNDASNNSASVTLSQPGISGQLSAVSYQQFIPVVVQKISPNPTSDELNLAVSYNAVSGISSQVSATSATEFLFYNVLGTQLRSEKRNLEQGINQINFDVSDFASGIYFIEIRNEKFEIRNPVRFVKQ